MNTINKIVGILMVVTVVATVKYFRKAKESQQEELVVGTSPDFEPFSYFSESGEVVGFDIDLIKEVAARLHMPYRLESMPFDTLLPNLQFGSVQVIASGMSPTPERAERVNFSNAYIQEDPLTIVTLAGNTTINSLEDLKGKNVAVIQGYVSDTHLSKIPEINLLRLPSLADVMLALKHGKVDAFVNGSRAVKPLQDAVGADTLKLVPINEIVESTALGIAKNRTDLVEKINKALQDMTDDGTLAALLEKWKLN